MNYGYDRTRQVETEESAKHKPFQFADALWNSLRAEIRSNGYDENVNDYIHTLIDVGEDESVDEEALTLFPTIGHMAKDPDLHLFDDWESFMAQNAKPTEYWNQIAGL